ncbi:hypothetical protein PR202_gb09501 [Eleusine coracana subsp. coracana]|uniref:Uncharacterized protein n=1 Tax=Eleusine coracana subsp. coracana TaxID=191504 RepID=A0AAV5EGS3_ELECO|nr:hypothetical protein PR202_gb09501 [Eleusine coracana subsp. coracana]
MLSAASNSAHSRHSRNDSVIRHKSGYEPSDTETEWHESPWNDAALKSERTRLPKDPGRNTHVPNHIREYHDDKTSNLRNNRTPPRVAEQRRQPSPYAGGKIESRKKNSRTPPRFRSSMESFSRSSIKERFTRKRSTSTPKLRPHEKDHPARAPAFLGTNLTGNVEEDSLAENCSQEINELIGNSKGPNSRYNEYAFTSTESIPTGDIFFSRDCRAPLEKISAKHNNNNKQFTSNTNADVESDDGCDSSSSKFTFFCLLNANILLCQISHSLKSCNGQGSSSVPILIPLSSSDHHVELNIKSQSKKARYALMTLANEMASKRKITEPSGRKSFKVLVLYDVDKVSENNQRLIKWIIDSSSDVCKIIMTCQDESDLLDSIKSRCKLITISAPDTREVRSQQYILAFSSIT